MVVCAAVARTWFGIDDHLLPRMRCWVVAAVGHVLAGAELQDFHEAKRNAPLKKKLLVEGAVAAAVPAALRTSGQGRWEELAKMLTFTLEMLNILYFLSCRRIRLHIQVHQTE